MSIKPVTPIKMGIISRPSAKKMRDL
jgi:hypothetical protein